MSDENETLASPRYSEVLVVDAQGSQRRRSAAAAAEEASTAAGVARWCGNNT